MTFQQICKDVHTVKTNGQQVFIESRNRPPPRKNTCAGKENGQQADGGIKPQCNDVEGQPRLACPSHACPGAAGFRTINSDAIRESIADLTQSPRSLVPAALLQKEPSTGYSYQQINCLDSIIRSVLKLETVFFLSSSSQPRHSSCVFLFYNYPQVLGEL